MNRTHGRALPLTVLVVALALLIGSILWSAAWSDGTAGRWGPGMMPGAGVAGTGPVTDLDEAERAADEFARQLGLGVGEVMEFDNGFYAILVDAGGANTTEVLIDPRTGAVQIEWGPAMMWNTGYGMVGGHWFATSAVDRDEARGAAEDWLQTYRSDERVGEVEAFPGYFTIHTENADGRIVGMLSVDAETGAVWYHTWHGDFIASTEDA